MFEALQVFIISPKGIVLIDCLMFFLFLTSKYVLKAKEVRPINHKVAAFGLLPYLNLVFILFFLLAIRSKLIVCRNKKHYARNKMKTVKLKY